MEIDNYGFYLMRSSTGQWADAVTVNADVIPAQGSKSGGASYTYTDGDVIPGQTYTYWLVDVDLNGMETIHRESAVGDQATNFIYLPTIVREQSKKHIHLQLPVGGYCTPQATLAGLGTC